MKKNIVMCMSLLIVIMITGCGAKGTFSVDPEDTQRVGWIMYQSDFPSDFSDRLFTDRYVSEHVVKSGGVTNVFTDSATVQFGQVWQVFRGFCSNKGGTIVRRYIPAGFNSVITKGFSDQAAYFYDSDMGRTEYEWCVVDSRPLFSMAVGGKKGMAATDLHIVEGRDMEALMNSGINLVLNLAVDASKTSAVYGSIAPVGRELIVSVAELNLTGQNPVLRAAFINRSNTPQTVDLGVAVGLMLTNERYLLTPAYQGGDALNIAIEDGQCQLDPGRSTLTIDAGELVSCSIRIAFDADNSYRHISAENAILFFAGRAIDMAPQSELDTENSNIWLKRRLDEYRQPLIPTISE